MLIYVLRLIARVDKREFRKEEAIHAQLVREKSFYDRGHKVCGRNLCWNRIILLSRKIRLQRGSTGPKGARKGLLYQCHGDEV